MQRFLSTKKLVTNFEEIKSVTASRLNWTQIPTEEEEEEEAEDKEQIWPIFNEIH